MCLPGTGVSSGEIENPPSRHASRSRRRSPLGTALTLGSTYGRATPFGRPQRHPYRVTLATILIVGVHSLKRDEVAAQYLYETIYCARGEMQNRIKECQLDLFADRTSAETMPANQLRLWVCLAGLRNAVRVAPHRLCGDAVCCRHPRHETAQAA
jgi:hypothetical protein